MTDNFRLENCMASWKDMTLRLVGYFGKTSRLAVLSHPRDSTASTCSEFDGSRSRTDRARIHVRVRVHETSFRERRRARYNFFCCYGPDKQSRGQDNIKLLIPSILLQALYIQKMVKELILTWW